IAAQKKVISYGQKWQVQQLKPYLYHVKRKGWQGFYWKVNTSRKKVYLVSEGTFGQLGGTEEGTTIQVELVE
ncbi:hypothetical protein KAH55_11935, partial [bacterium]|nr:hypothetical protein [bacterium]